MRVAAAIVAFVALPTLVVAQVIPRQSPRFETDSELQDPTGLVVGVTGGAMAAGREAFESVGLGVVGHFFVGSQFGPIHEIRLGGALGSSPEQHSDDRVRTVSLYAEMYFATEVLGMTVQAGPRAAWMRETRAIYAFGHLSGFGLGGNAGVQVPLGPRFAFEGGGAVTLFQFGAADIPGEPLDADRYSNGVVYELRAGVRCRVL